MKTDLTFRLRMVHYLGAFSRAPISGKCVVLPCQITYFNEVSLTFACISLEHVADIDGKMTEQKGN
jgi:hypothetical protein